LQDRRSEPGEQQPGRDGREGSEKPQARRENKPGEWERMEEEDAKAKNYCRVCVSGLLKLVLTLPLDDLRPAPMQADANNSFSKFSS
jgi:hypothetical protein